MACCYLDTVRHTFHITGYNIHICQRSLDEIDDVVRSTIQPNFLFLVAIQDGVRAHRGLLITANFLVLVMLPVANVNMTGQQGDLRILRDDSALARQRDIQAAGTGWCLRTRGRPGGNP